jgi:phosphoribosylanthranilate isomerase
VTRVKICGIRRLEDALLAAELGASALGFIFWPSSPRFVDPFRARPIVRSLPPFVSAVGVFVNQPREFIDEVARLLSLGAVQLHGDELPDFYAGAPYRVIKSVAVTGDAHATARQVATVPAGATILLDAHDPIKRGGTGRTIDWSQAAALARSRPLILSGGLDASNVGAAIEAVNPYAIDVSSGVESSPGVKNPEKLRSLFDAVHSRIGERAHGKSR